MTTNDEVNILEHLPTVLQEVKELKIVAELENPTLVEEWQKVQNVLDNQFIFSADEEGIARQEKMLGILKQSTDTLESRRLRIATYYTNEIPYTKNTIARMLDAQLGDDKYSLDINQREKKLTVEIDLEYENIVEITEDLLDRTTPQTYELTSIQRVSATNNVCGAFLDGEVVVLYPAEV